MNWQYRTILFEFQKDGLLGDKYIDDDEVEEVLNQQGATGWELVGVSPVQEGLLSFFKRPIPTQASRPAPPKPAKPAEEAAPKAAPPAGAPQQKPLPAAKPAPAAGERREPEKPLSKPGGVGSIKIS